MKVKSLSAINPPEHIAKVIGTKKGRLKITAFAGRYDHRYYVIVKCECGEEKIVNASNLLWGTTVSCGCYNYGDKFKKKKVA